MTEKLILLGSTGSIGRQALEVCRDKKIGITALAGGSNITLLESQIREFKPKMCGVFDEKAADTLKIKVADTPIKIVSGKNAASVVAEEADGDTVLNAISGIAGLRPTLSTIRSGKKRLALANKESLVTAGRLVKKEIEKFRTELVPVDSEHSAIFQCLGDQKIRRLILTASGGPFYGKKRSELNCISPKEALNHPTWNMGGRITVDSATLMNKGFEVIEAIHLFNVNSSQIEVTIHRESLVHSMVEYEDGAVLAEMGIPDMRFCIQYALTYPERKTSLLKKMDFTQFFSLSFDKPDTNTFRLLPLAYRAYERGENIPAAMNGADEEAVGLFLNGKIAFNDITDIVENVTDSIGVHEISSVDDVENTDSEARESVRKLAGIK